MWFRKCREASTMGEYNRNGEIETWVGIAKMREEKEEQNKK